MKNICRVKEETLKVCAFDFLAATAGGVVGSPPRPDIINTASDQFDRGTIPYRPLSLHIYPSQSILSGDASWHHLLQVSRVCLGTTPIVIIRIPTLDKVSAEVKLIGATTNRTILIDSGHLLNLGNILMILPC